MSTTQLLLAVVALSLCATVVSAASPFILCYSSDDGLSPDALKQLNPSNISIVLAQQPFANVSASLVAALDAVQSRYFVLTNRDQVLVFDALSLQPAALPSLPLPFQPNPPLCVFGSDPMFLLSWASLSLRLAPGFLSLSFFFFVIVPLQHPAVRCKNRFVVDHLQLLRHDPVLLHARVVGQRPDVQRRRPGHARDVSGRGHV